LFDMSWFPMITTWVIKAFMHRAAVLTRGPRAMRLTLAAYSVRMTR
jgi:hypothetical protein